MGLIDRLLRRGRGKPVTAEAKTVVRREDLEPAAPAESEPSDAPSTSPAAGAVDVSSEGLESAAAVEDEPVVIPSTSPAEEAGAITRERTLPGEGEPTEARQAPSAQVSTAAVAEAALRDAVSAVQGLADRARNYVAELSSIESKRRDMPPERTVQAGPSPGGALMTEASATVLIEYLKHFFDLVSMQNRLLERRLDSLEELIARLDEHVTEDAAEISLRLATLEGVQLPLVKPAGEQVSGEAPAAQAAAEAEPEPITDEQRFEEEPTPPLPTGTTQPEVLQEVVQVQGLASFRALFAVRDELRSRAGVLSAEAASFEAGNAALRLKATRDLDSREIQEALSEATGQDFEVVGPLSFAAAREERQTA